MEPAALRARVPALLLGVLRVRRFLPYPTHHSRVRFPFFCWASDVAAVPTECDVLVARSRRATSRALLRAAATAGPPPSKATRTRTTRDAGSKSRRERQATVARSVSRKSLGASSAATRNKYHLRRALPRRRREARRLSIWSVPAPSLVGLHQKGQWNKKKVQWNKKTVPRWVAGWHHYLPVPAAAQQTRRCGLGQPAVQGCVTHGQARTRRRSCCSTTTTAGSPTSTRGCRA